MNTNTKVQPSNIQQKTSAITDSPTFGDLMRDLTALDESTSRRAASLAENNQLMSDLLKSIDRRKIEFVRIQEKLTSSEQLVAKLSQDYKEAIDISKQFRTVTFIIAIFSLAYLIATGILFANILAHTSPCSNS